MSAVLIINIDYIDSIPGNKSCETIVKIYKFKKWVGIDLCTATKCKETRNTEDPDTDII